MILLDHGIKKVKYVKNNQQNQRESAVTPLNTSNNDASFSTSASIFLNATAISSKKQKSSRTIPQKDLSTFSQGILSEHRISTNPKHIQGISFKKPDNNNRDNKESPPEPLLQVKPSLKATKRNNNINNQLEHYQVYHNQELKKQHLEKEANSSSGKLLEWHTQERKNRLVEVGELVNGVSKKNFNRDQVLCILEQVATNKHLEVNQTEINNNSINNIYQKQSIRNKNENLKPIRMDFKLNQAARSHSPRLKRIPDNQLRQLKQIAFLNMLSKEEQAASVDDKNYKKYTEEPNQLEYESDFVLLKDKKNEPAMLTIQTNRNNRHKIISMGEGSVVNQNNSQTNNSLGINYSLDSPQKQQQRSPILYQGNSQQSSYPSSPLPKIKPPSSLDSKNSPALEDFSPLLQGTRNHSRSPNKQIISLKKNNIVGKHILPAISRITQNIHSDLVKEEEKIQKPIWKPTRIINTQDSSLFYFKDLIIGKDNEKGIHSEESLDALIKKEIPPIPKPKSSLILRSKSPCGTTKPSQIKEYSSEFQYVIETALQQMHKSMLGNRILDVQEKRILELISKFDSNISEIDLSNGFLTSICLQLLLDKFNQQQITLQHFKLPNTHLNDEGLSILSNSLSSSRSLLQLDLSHNNLTDNGNNDLNYIIVSNPQLQGLNLSFNQLSAVAMKTIFHTIVSQYQNSNLKVLDLAHNTIGHASPIALKQFLDEFDQFMVLNSSLLHLDMRNNYFTRENLEIIKKSIIQNKTILGIHLSNGYDCYMDSQNNLKLIQFEQLIQLPQQCAYNPIDFLNKKRKFKHKKKNNTEDYLISESDNCWICEGWVEQEFECRLPETQSSLYNADQAVFLHLEIDDYQPCFMKKKNREDLSYAVIRMVPPKTSLKFYFSHDGGLSLLLSPQLPAVTFKSYKSVGQPLKNIEKISDYRIQVEEFSHNQQFQAAMLQQESQKSLLNGNKQDSNYNQSRKIRKNSLLKEDRHQQQNSSDSQDIQEEADQNDISDQEQQQQQGCGFSSVGWKIDNSTGILQLKALNILESMNSIRLFDDALQPTISIQPRQDIFLLKN